MKMPKLNPRHDPGWVGARLVKADFCLACGAFFFAVVALSIFVPEKRSNNLLQIAHFFMGKVFVFGFTMHFGFGAKL